MSRFTYSVLPSKKAWLSRNLLQASTTATRSSVGAPPQSGVGTNRTTEFCADYPKWWFEHTNAHPSQRTWHHGSMLSLLHSCNKRSIVQCFGACTQTVLPGRCAHTKTVVFSAGTSPRQSKWQLIFEVLRYASMQQANAVDA